MCDLEFLHLCLSRPEAGQSYTLFGFSQFVEALALLILVFNLADARARFRALIAPLPLLPITFGSILLIGLGTLVTDVWIDQRWPALPWGWSRVEIDAVFGAWFLALVLVWIAVSYVWPPRFGPWNHKRFLVGVYRATVRGSDTELPIILSEIQRSMETLVDVAGRTPRRNPHVDAPIPPLVESANHVLLTLGSRKVCRHVVASVPELAILAMTIASERMARHLGSPTPGSLAQFARNVSLEALLNPDSGVYHEDSGFNSGMIGYTQPFTRALYANYKLVESLGAGGRSPLDVDYEFFQTCTAAQFERYCHIVQMTCSDYVARGYMEHSFVLHRAFGNLERGVARLYTLNGTEGGAAMDPESAKLYAVIRLVSDLIDEISKAEDYPLGRVRRPDPKSMPGHGHDDGLIDLVVNLLFEVIQKAAAVRAPAGLAWSIHYISIWGQLFGLKQGPVWRIVQRKLCRHLYEEIRSIERFPNYVNAQVLGFCLHVLGLRHGRRNVAFDRPTVPFREAVLAWTKRHYMAFRAATNDGVGEASLSGNITFDSRRRALVQTGFHGLHKQPPQHVFKLDPAPRPRRVKAPASVP
jgi:hypothetical protein